MRQACQQRDQSRYHRYPGGHHSGGHGSECAVCPCHRRGGFCGGQRDHEKTFELKELRVTPNIEQHDFEFKAKNARKFLQDGNKVKITVRFRGRELNYVKAGEETLNEFIENLSDIATVEKKPLLEGKNMFVILAKKVEK